MKDSIEIKSNTLFFDGCNTIDLAKEYGTPLYVFSENDIIGRFEELKECFIDKYPKTRVAYAAKAFCTIAMCKLVEQQGMCIDVVSGGELYTAIKAGFPPERIEFNGNNKTREELEMAIEYGIGRIIMDGLQELSLIEEICQEKGKKISVLYRITPGVKSSTHDYIVTGKKDSKFGVPLDEEVIIPSIWEAINSEYVDFLGLHFHVGSQIFDNDSHLQAVNIVLKLVEKIKNELNFEIKELNLGGGFGVKYTDEERKPFSYFLDPMMNLIADYYNANNLDMPSIVIEPGRSIVAEGGLELYKIGSIKDIKNIRKYVAVDGGMSDNIRPALYQSEYAGIIANKAEEEKDDLVTICGKTCESGDVLIRDIRIAQAVAGDIFAVFSTGAYGYSMANNYNRLLIPAVVMVKDGKSRVIVKRQTYEDLLRNDL